MAYWGEAMTHNHPVWMEQDAAAARAVLARLAPSREARQAKAASYRERVWLDAVETLYGEGSKEERDRGLFAGRWQPSTPPFPTMSTPAPSTRCRCSALPTRAGRCRSTCVRPHCSRRRSRTIAAIRGSSHYLIHSYDDATHAPLGLRAARLYGAVAPEAGHALHMTSHIFLAMGMWEAAERANVAAIETVQPPARCGGPGPGPLRPLCRMAGLCPPAAKRGRRGRGRHRRVPRGRQPRARLRPGRQPGRILPLRRALLGRHGRPPADRDWLAGSDALPLPEGRYLATRFTLAYADLLAAGRDAAKVKEARARLQQAHSSLTAARGEAEPNPAEARREVIVLRQAAGIEKLATGDAEGGLADLGAAAEMEASMPAEFGPPLVEKPSRELLADALLALGRRDEALQAYRAALAAAPGRRLTLRGLQAR